MTYTATYYYIDSRLPTGEYDVTTIANLVQKYSSIDSKEAQGGPAPSIEDLISARNLFINNVRASLIISALGIISFSVVGILAYIMNLAILGGVLAAVRLIGLSPWVTFAAGILPHGIFELPALLLSVAAVLYVSLRIVTPEKHLSIGEVFVFAVADWLKIFIAVCLPLFLVAALVEANITRWIVEWMLGRMTVLPGG